MVHLDTREARCDLTSREACKLLCGLLAGCVVAGIETGLLRKFFEAAVGMVQRPVSEHSVDQAEERIQELFMSFDGLPITEATRLRAILTMLSAALGAIGEQTPADALMTACQWIIERDEVWQAFQQGSMPMIH